MTGLVGMYAHGNEPSHHVAYLYAYAGAPYKTQERVRRSLDEQYDNTPRRPLRQRRLRPDVRLVRHQRARLLRGRSGRRELRLRHARCSTAPWSTWAHGRKLTIEAMRKAPGDKYVQSVTLNGKPYSKVWFPHSAIAKGGSIVFTMGAQPNKEFGAAPSTVPPSLPR